MAWKKPSPELVERFSSALPKHPDAEPKKMFGYPACFVKGNFFVGLHEQHFVVRLPGDLKNRFPELNDAEGFNPMGKGKPMKDWWVVPAEIADNDERLAKFFDAAFAEIHTLPPKAPRPKASRKATKRA